MPIYAITDYFQDIEAIRSLYRRAPEGNIFFAVTKVDPEEKACESADEDDSDTEETPTDPLVPSKIETEKRERIFNKLIENGFIEKQPMAACRNFHALSSRNVKRYRRALKEFPQTDETRATLMECRRYMDDFIRFKSCLLEFTRKQLIQTVTNATKVLQCSLMECLDYFIARANAIFEDKLSNEKNIKLIEAEEYVLSQVMQKMIKDASKAFENVVAAVVNQHKDSIIEMASQFNYVEFTVPKDGFIERSSVDRCKAELRDEILRKVSDLIHNEVINKCDTLDEVYDALSKRVKEMQAKLGDKIPIHDALQVMFISNYKFDIHKAKLARTFWQKLKYAIISITTLEPIRKAIGGRVNVKEQSWKVNVAKELLEVIHPSNVADVIVSGMVAHVEDGHKAFTARLNDLKELYKRSHMLGDSDRNMIRLMSPLIGRLQLDAWNIIDSLKFGELTYGKVRGKGAQGVVQDCSAVGPNGEACVAKVVKIENEKEMGEMALEIHYTRLVPDSLKFTY